MNLFDGMTLECFMAVVDTGSFTKASYQVGRTQSAISQQISKLESLVGKRLFVRDKKLTLTPEGELLRTYARKIVHLNREAMDHFKHPYLTGEIRFGSPEDFASVLLADVLAKYTALHPRVFLHIECDMTVNLFERFKQKEFDLVLLKMNAPKNFPNGIEVWSEPLEWAGAKEGHSLFEGKTIPLVLSPNPCVYRARAIETLEKHNRKWRIVFSSPSYAGTTAAVRAGMGVTVLPRTMIPHDLRVISKDQNMPPLENTHISLLKHSDKNKSLNSFEQFIFHKLRG